MTTKVFRSPLFLLFVVLFVSGCAILGGTPSAPIDAPALYTQAAQTVVVQVTIAAGQTAVAQLTQIASGQAPVGNLATATPGGIPTQPGATLPPATQVPPTATLVPPTNTPLPPTATLPPPTATLVPPTNTPIPPTPIPCNWAQFVKDVTVGDGAIYTPGAQLTKVWRLRNVGSCTWNTDYALVFVDGTAMTDKTSVKLAERIRPGETVDLSVVLAAPGKDGRYRGNWMLRSDGGKLFGIGNQADKAFWVEIRVATPPNPAFSYDFAANYCNATWRTGAGTIGCWRGSDDSNGFVSLLNNPELETRNENELALWVRPNNNNGGWISGQFPAYTIKDGDHFRADVGCLKGSSGCKVTFQLEYEQSNGVIKKVGSWQEAYDGKSTLIDVDLSPLAGNAVKFILTVYNDARAKDANAYWFVPQILNIAARSEQVITWRQQGGANNRCEELRIFLSGATTAKAQAFSCVTGETREIGATTLNADQVKAIVNWVTSFKPFTTEFFPPFEGQVVTLNLVGRGSAVASDADGWAMADFCQQVYNTIKK